jgi:hypothetical protein
MKLRIGAIATLALAITLAMVPQPARAHVDVSFDFFYSNLSPHGSWMVSSQYGRVWQPAVYSRDWNPYYDGHWEYTDCGWTWASDYAWGGVPYHYGTWVRDPFYGWVWVPGYTWAPAWVTFRTGPDYIGWAPVSPGFSIGVSYGAPAFDSFLFVSTRNFAAPRIRSYVVPEYRARTIVNHTTVVNNITVQNNIVVNRGPDVHMVEQASRTRIPVRRVEQVARVAPFSTVSRQDLAIAPERSRRSVRAAEPVPESRPLPSAGDRASNRGGSDRFNRPDRQSNDIRELDRDRRNPPERQVSPRQPVRPDRDLDRSPEVRENPRTARPPRTEPADRVPDQRERAVPQERVSPKPRATPPERTVRPAERPRKPAKPKPEPSKDKNNDGHGNPS